MFLLWDKSGFQLMLYGENWKLNQGEEFKGRVKVDKRYDALVEANILNTQAINYVFGFEKSAWQAIQAGNKITMEGPAGKKSFRLNGTSKAINVILECADEYFSPNEEPQQDKVAARTVSPNPDYKTGMKAYKAKDYKAALKEWMPLAEQDDPKAQNSLGFMYLNGRGIAKDKAKAVFWFRKAADHGNARAQGNLGIMYENGWGVAKNDTKAVYWYRKAAKQGYAKAEKNLKRIELAMKPTPVEPVSQQPVASVVPGINPTQPTFQPDVGVEVQFSGLPASGQDWLAISGKGQGPKQYFDIVMLKNRPHDGVHKFKPLPEGEYEVRLYTNWPDGGYEIVASSGVDVASLPVQPQPAQPLPVPALPQASQPAAPVATVPAPVITPKSTEKPVETEHSTPQVEPKSNTLPTVFAKSPENTPIVPESATEVKNEELAGTWAISQGIFKLMVFQQVMELVEGRMSGPDGRFSGEIAAGRMTGLWTSGDGSVGQVCSTKRLGASNWGTIEAVLDPGGTILSGLWGACDQPASHEFKANRASKNVSAKTDAPQDSAASEPTKVATFDENKSPEIPAKTTTTTPNSAEMPKPTEKQPILGKLICMQEDLSGLYCSELKSNQTVRAGRKGQHRVVCKAGEQAQLYENGTLAQCTQAIESTIQMPDADFASIVCAGQRISFNEYDIQHCDEAVLKNNKYEYKCENIRIRYESGEVAEERIVSRIDCGTNPNSDNLISAKTTIGALQCKEIELHRDLSVEKCNQAVAATIIYRGDGKKYQCPDEATYEFEKNGKLVSLPWGCRSDTAFVCDTNSPVSKLGCDKLKSDQIAKAGRDGLQSVTCKAGEKGVLLENDTLASCTPAEAAIINIQGLDDASVACSGKLIKFDNNGFRKCENAVLTNSQNEYRCDEFELYREPGKTKGQWNVAKIECRASSDDGHDTRIETSVGSMRCDWLNLRSDLSVIECRTGSPVRVTDNRDGEEYQCPAKSTFAFANDGKLKSLGKNCRSDTTLVCDTRWPTGKRGCERLKQDQMVKAGRDGQYTVVCKAGLQAYMNKDGTLERCTLGSELTFNIQDLKDTTATCAAGYISFNDNGFSACNSSSLKNISHNYTCDSLSVSRRTDKKTGHIVVDSIRCGVNQSSGDKISVKSSIGTLQCKKVGLRNDLTVQSCEGTAATSFVFHGDGDKYRCPEGDNFSFKENGQLRFFGKNCRTDGAKIKTHLVKLGMVEPLCNEWSVGSTCTEKGILDEISLRPGDDTKIVCESKYVLRADGSVRYCKLAAPALIPVPGPDGDKAECKGTITTSKMGFVTQCEQVKPSPIRVTLPGKFGNAVCMSEVNKLRFFKDGKLKTCEFQKAIAIKTKKADLNCRAVYFDAIKGMPYLRYCGFPGAGEVSDSEGNTLICDQANGMEVIALTSEGGIDFKKYKNAPKDFCKLKQ